MPDLVLLAEVTLSTETIALLTVVLSAMAGAMGYVFRTLIQAVKEDRDSWKQMAEEGINNLEKAAGRYQKDSKTKRVKPVVAVIPEHSSPPTVEQKDTADIQTARAKLVAATLALELPSRDATEAKKAGIGTAIEAAAEISAVAAEEIDKLDAKSKAKPDGNAKP